MIETGVDKLVRLVKQNKRISVPDAAKALDVSKVVVEEWSDFLEEEGIISIEYKFTTPYLVDRVLSKKEVEDKVKEFNGQREGFVRKAEVCLSLLDKKGEVFQNVKEEFQRLKGELGGELQAVQTELRLFEKYNQEKRNIDNEIKQQELEFKQKIHDMESQIVKERERYSEILEDIKREQKELDKEKLQSMSFRQTIKAMEATITKFDSTVADIKNNLASEEHNIDGSEAHIERLKALAEAAKKDIENRSAQMKELLVKSEEQEKKIGELQRQILEKALRQKKSLEKPSKIDKGYVERLKKLFEHNKKIEDYLAQVNSEKDRLAHEFSEIIKKARAFRLIARGQDIKQDVSDLHKKFLQVEKDKDQFEKEVSKLRSVIKG
jgi:chromosome segregation ATPase